MEDNDTTPSLPPASGPSDANWVLYNAEPEPTAEVRSTGEIPVASSGPSTAEIPSTGGTGATMPPPFTAPTFEAPAPHSAHRARRGIAAAVAAGAAAAFIGVGLGHYVWPSTTTSSSVSNQASGSLPFGSGGTSLPSGFGGSSSGSQSQSGNQGTSSSAAVNAVAAKVSPALVDINTNLGYESASAAGTGIVLTSNGTILTNNHVIDGATQITATDIGNGKTYKATVVGYDRSKDVAVIQLEDASGLTTATFGSSRNVAVGQSIIGIGNAGGAGGKPSTAAGTVTALNQSITASDESSGTSEQLSGLIQTDAPIQPGDSGGPLVTTSGLVVGMDTAASENYTFSGNSNSQTQGFSIPAATALTIAHEIISHQASSTIHLGLTGFMGVQVQSGSSSLSPFGGSSTPSQTTGVSIVGTVSGSPAANAGLGDGDTITAINGTTVTTPEQLSEIISQYHPGDTISLSWTDSSGDSHTSSITLAKGPAA